MGLAPNQSRPLSGKVGKQLGDNLDRSTAESTMSFFTARIVQHTASGQLDESVQNGISNRVKQRRIAVVIPEHCARLDRLMNFESEIKLSMLWH